MDKETAKIYSAIQQDDDITDILMQIEFLHQYAIHFNNQDKFNYFRRLENLSQSVKNLL